MLHHHHADAQHPYHYHLVHVQHPYLHRQLATTCQPKPVRVKRGAKGNLHAQRLFALQTLELATNNKYDECNYAPFVRTGLSYLGWRGVDFLANPVYDEATASVGHIQHTTFSVFQGAPRTSGNDLAYYALPHSWLYFGWVQSSRSF
jgi:hypothetical protein